MYSTPTEFERQTTAVTAKKPEVSFRALGWAKVGALALEDKGSLRAWGKYLAPEVFMVGRDRSKRISNRVSDAYRSLVQPLGLVASVANDAASNSQRRKKEELEQAKQAAARESASQ